MIKNNLSKRPICCLLVVGMVLVCMPSLSLALGEEPEDWGGPESAITSDEPKEREGPEPALASEQERIRGTGTVPHSAPEQKRRKPKYEVPLTLLGDVVDVRVDKLPGQSRITIITTTPLLFEASEGRNGDDMNYLTIEIPNTRLVWPKKDEQKNVEGEEEIIEDEQRRIEVDHGGVKDITLIQLHQPGFKVEAKIKLLPQASYNIYSTKDAKGIVIEVREEAPEEPEEVVEEEAVEELSPALISIDVVDADIQQVLKTVAEQGKLNIVTHPEVKGQITVRLKDVSVKTALDLILGANGLAYTKVDNTLVVSSQCQIAKMITSSEVIKLKHIDAESARDMLMGVIASDCQKGAIQVNKETNSIIITASNVKLKEIKKIIEEVDKPVFQVRLDAKVIEVGIDATKELGIDWSQGIGVTFREKSREPVFSATEVVGGEPFFRMYNLVRTAFEAKLKALVDNGQAKILSSPRIVAMKDEEAKIFIGDRVPYTVTTATGGVAMTEVRFIEPGIKLHITPKIVNDDFVVMDVAPEVSYIYSFRGPQDEYPWVKTREAKASVRIKDGETLILGGLLSSENKETVSKVPFLSDIPLVGELFKSTKLVNNDTELLIVVTPTIMKER